MYENLAQKAREGRINALAVASGQSIAGATRSGRNTASSKLVFLSSRQNRATFDFLA